MRSKPLLGELSHINHNIQGLETFASISAFRKQVCNFKLAPFILQHEMYVLSSREFLIARLCVYTAVDVTKICYEKYC